MFYLMDDETLMKVAGLLGEEAISVVKVLKEVDEITDNEIVDRTKIQLNTVRKILYQLYDHSLIALRQTRDKDTGWFIFHWRLQPDQLEGFILNKKRRVLEKLKNIRPLNDFSCIHCVDSITYLCYISDVMCDQQ